MSFVQTIVLQNKRYFSVSHDTDHLMDRQRKSLKTSVLNNYEIYRLLYRNHIN
jgi:hypothetical protein